MVSAIANLWISFLAGLFAPLGAVCILPLYPGFLAYLSNKLSEKKYSEKGSKKTISLLGAIVTLGVILSMFIIGLIFSFFLQESLTNAIAIISPIAFALLSVISILLIFDVDLGKFLPRINAPVLKNPYFSSLVFGLFFGVIVLPCNPASLAVLFAVSTSTMSFILNFLNFFLFGVGMGLPLLLFSIVSAAKSRQVIGFLATHKKKINFIAGIIMLGVSLYYLFVVFKIHKIFFGMFFG